VPSYRGGWKVTAAVRVAVDARQASGYSGGVETMIIGLADGFSELDLTGMDISFVAFEGKTDWLRPHLGAGLRLETVPAPRPASARLAAGLGPLAQPARRLKGFLPKPYPRIERDTSMDAFGADVVHFTHQLAGLVGAPSIYQPHDLQHRHLPQLFSRRTLIEREATYAPLCNAARMVVVATSWVKGDLVEQFRIDPAKIVVIPLAPLRATANPANDPSGFPEQYLLYPAAAWPHKNHERLLAAFRMLVDANPDAHLVLTGARVDSGAVDIAGLIRRHRLGDHVHPMGFLPEAGISTAYAHARGVVIPTLFESASFPIWEAFQRGIAVACSAVCALPSQVEDGAILFDPKDVNQIAAALDRLWNDEGLRNTLIARGRARVRQFSWPDTAARYVALYRTLAGNPSPSDQALLAEEPKL
jgi:glycosyltransferase involved in cell wall biosynthesis